MIERWETEGILAAMQSAFAKDGFRMCPICGGRICFDKVLDMDNFDSYYIAKCNKCGEYVRYNTPLDGDINIIYRGLLHGWKEIRDDYAHKLRQREHSLSYHKKLRRSMGRLPRVIWR